MHELLNALVSFRGIFRARAALSLIPRHSALESLPDIVHTKDGSAVVRELIVRGNAKVVVFFLYMT